jgi:hypothetical protein
MLAVRAAFRVPVCGARIPRRADSVMCSAEIDRRAFLAAGAMLPAFSESLPAQAADIESSEWELVCPSLLERS